MLERRIGSLDKKLAAISTVILTLVVAVIQLFPSDDVLVTTPGISASTQAVILVGFLVLCTAIFVCWLVARMWDRAVKIGRKQASGSEVPLSREDLLVRLAQKGAVALLENVASDEDVTEMFPGPALPGDLAEHDPRRRGIFTNLVFMGAALRDEEELLVALADALSNWVREEFLSLGDFDARECVVLHIGAPDGDSPGWAESYGGGIARQMADRLCRTLDFKGSESVEDFLERPSLAMSRKGFKAVLLVAANYDAGVYEAVTRLKKLELSGVPLRVGLALLLSPLRPDRGSLLVPENLVLSFERAGLYNEDDVMRAEVREALTQSL